MVNPLLTIVFDLFLVGSAFAIVAAMVAEYLDSRRPAVGTGAKKQHAHAVQRSQASRAHRRAWRPIRKAA